MLNFDRARILRPRKSYGFLLLLLLIIIVGGTLFRGLVGEAGRSGRRAFTVGDVASSTSPGARR